MKFEVEQKFRVSDLASVRAMLSDLGARCFGSVEQVDTYFRHPSRDFAATDEALRLRRSGDECCITYKGPKIDATTKTRREIELPLPHQAQTYDQFRELLEALGFQCVTDVRKRRAEFSVPWRGREVEVALDEVDRVGDFVELELQADEATLDPTRRCIADLAQRLDLSEGERRSYLELLLENTSGRR